MQLILQKFKYRFYLLSPVRKLFVYKSIQWQDICFSGIILQQQFFIYSTPLPRNISKFSISVTHKDVLFIYSYVIVYFNSRYDQSHFKGSTPCFIKDFWRT